MTEETNDSGAIADLGLVLALQAGAALIRRDGKTVDETIAILRATVSEVVASMRHDVVVDVLGEGPADMKEIAARALTKHGAKLSHNQVEPVFADLVPLGRVTVTEVPRDRGRPRTVYALAGDSVDVGDGDRESLAGAEPISNASDGLPE